MIEFAGIALGSKRRVAIDVALLGAILACGLAFGELRSTVATLRETLPQMDKRIDQLETRERLLIERITTKDDVRRLESQITEIRALILNRSNRND